MSPPQPPKAASTHEIPHGQAFLPMPRYSQWSTTTARSECWSASRKQSVNEAFCKTFAAREEVELGVIDESTLHSPFPERSGPLLPRSGPVPARAGVVDRRQTGLSEASCWAGWDPPDRRCHKRPRGTTKQQEKPLCCCSTCERPSIKSAQTGCDAAVISQAFKSGPATPQGLAEPSEPSGSAV